jgi:hypothetical protein
MPAVRAGPWTVGQVHNKNPPEPVHGHPHDAARFGMVDLRDYSEAQWKAQIGAFIDSLPARASAA